LPVLSLSDFLIIVCIAVAVFFLFTTHLGKKRQKESFEAQSLLEQHKMVTPILVIEKRFEKPSPTNMPKAYYDKLPAKSRRNKYGIIKAKVGPQIATLFCDKPVFEVLTPKKTYKVELSGAIILGIEGMHLEEKKKKSFTEKMNVLAKKGETAVVREYMDKNKDKDKKKK